MPKNKPTRSELIAKVTAAKKRQDQLLAMIAQPINIIAAAAVPWAIISLINTNPALVRQVMEMLDSLMVSDGITPLIRNFEEMRRSCSQSYSAYFESKNNLLQGCTELSRAVELVTETQAKMKPVELATLKQLAKQIGVKSTWFNACAQLSEKIVEYTGVDNAQIRQAYHDLINILATHTTAESPNMQGFQHPTLETPATQYVTWNDEIFYPNFKQRCSSYRATAEKALNKKMEKVGLTYHRTISCILIMVSMAMRYVIGDRLFVNLMPAHLRPIPDIDRVLMESDIEQALKNFSKIEQQLEAYAHSVVKLTRILSLAALPIFIYMLFNIGYNLSAYGTVLSSLLSVATTNLLQDLRSWRRERDFACFKEALQKDVINIFQPLIVQSLIIEDYGSENSYLQLQLTKANQVKLNRRVQFLCLTAALTTLDIDYTLDRSYTLTLQNIRAFTHAKRQQLSTKIKAQVRRRLSINALEIQLQKINALDFNIMPMTDATKLPTLSVWFIRVSDENLKVLQNIFNENTWNEEENFWVMTGYHPARETDKLAQFAKKNSSVMRQALPVGEPYEADTLSSVSTLKKRGARGPLVKADLRIQPQEDAKIIIQWPSGKKYDSSLVTKEYLRTAGAIIPINSRFVKSNTQFICFDLSPNDFYEANLYNEFLTKTNEANLVAPSANQGLVYCDEPRSCWKYQWQNTPQGWKAVSRERLKYQSPLKVKLLGKNGDMRCYTISEKAPSGETLYRVVEFDPDTH